MRAGRPDAVQRPVAGDFDERNARPPGVRRWLALTAVLLGVVMTSLDNTVVNVALPSISRDLNAGVAGTAWVVDA